MEFITKIITILNNVSKFFYDIYLEVYSWVWPFWLISPLFYNICLAFNGLAWEFYYFGEWVYYVADKITSFLTQLDLEAWFSEWAAKILDAWNWVGDAWNNVSSIIDEWWEVKLALLTEWWEAQLAELRAMKDAWDNFWATILPNLLTWNWLEAWWDSQLLELEAWFNSQLQELLPFFNELMELWEGIKEFFVDPLQWLYDKMDEWFERFW